MENREGKTEDRRIRKTKQAIQSSLYRLLRKKDLREIRVKELAECADINRGTFYRYYEDVGDILLESEQVMFLAHPMTACLTEHTLSARNDLFRADTVA